ncbi:hypothetical protein [Salinispira pacifica]|uniref:Uncharacterized protein n=1 Tax=Salinispira pacifica TaxID=1307761 RepID=V5WEP0_9SPIO|nr:hypothetical protein [Salinispira pacifica]AHC14090.1 hypothetical protein L21SP2_0661 [Salinispira pacifica]
MKVFKPFPIIDEAAFITEWTIYNTSLPSEEPVKLTPGFNSPLVNSNWTSSHGVRVEVTTKCTDGRIFRDILPEGMNSNNSLQANIQLVSRVPSFRRASKYFVFDQGCSEFDLSMSIHSFYVPVTIRFRLVILDTGKKICEIYSPEFSFRGSGSEISIFEHGDADRPVWDWSIETEEPEFDQFSEVFLLSIYEGEMEYNKAISISSDSIYLSPVQQGFWASIISDLFITICTRDPVYIDLIVGGIEGEDFYSGSVISALHRWYHRIKKNKSNVQLSELINEPCELRRVVFKHLLQCVGRKI